jgi:O-antigen/teichoic acid export membrane protein
MSKAEAPGDKPERSLGAVLRHSAVYSLVPVASNVIAIVMVAFYTDWLHQHEMGVLPIVDLVLAVSTELLGISALAGMVRFYFDHESQRDKNAVISSTLILGSGLAWMVCGVALVFAEELRPILIGAPTQGVSQWYLGQVMTLVLLMVPFQMTTQTGFRFLMIHHRSGTLAGIQITKMLVELVLKIWFVAPAHVLPFGLGMGVRGMLLSVLIGEVVTSTCLSIWILRRVGHRVDWKVFKPMLDYSRPLIVASLYHLCLQRSDVRLIEYLLPVGVGLATAGIYGIGYRIGYLANQILLGPFLQVLLPWILDVKDKREQETLIARLTTYSLVFIGTAVIGISCFAREAVLVLDNSEGHKYESAYLVVPLVGGAYILWAVYRSMSETTFHLARRTRALSWYSLAALVTNLGLNLLWIPAYGAIGAAAATLAAYALLAILGEIGRYRLSGGSRLEYGRIAACLATVAIACSSAMAVDGIVSIPGEFNVVAIASKAALFLLAFAFLWGVVLTADERATFVGYARARLGRAH